MAHPFESETDTEMTDKLPPNLLALFAPRPPLRYLPASDFPLEDRRTPYLTPISDCLPAFRAKIEADKQNGYQMTDAPIVQKEKKKVEKQEHQKWLVGEGVKELYKPKEDKNIRGDPFKTLIVSRLAYTAESQDVKDAFRRFGPIERVRVVTDLKGDSRGYAFVLFEHEADMRAAYKGCENLMIKDRRVVVDVERGRTVADWRPRRFGGGLGGRHYTKVQARPPAFGMTSGSGYMRGGFRGGNDRFRGGRGGGSGFRGRGGYGSPNGGPPNGAPAGPRSGGGVGYGGGSSRGFGGGFEDRGRSNANYEPLPPRGGGGYRDRDRDDSKRSYGGGDRDDSKRSYGGGGYDDSQSRRRY